MKIKTTSKPIANHRDELIKAETIIHCVISQMASIQEFMEVQAIKNPACVVYNDVLTDIIDKLADVESICINAK